MKKAIAIMVLGLQNWDKNLSSSLSSHCPIWSLKILQFYTTDTQRNWVVDPYQRNNYH